MHDPSHDAGDTVVYLHGLESGPQAGKVVALRAAGFTVVAPQLDTAAVMELIRVRDTDPVAIHLSLDAPLAQAIAAVREARPAVVVGSSFGAAVLLRLLHESGYSGFTAVLLAGAGLKLTGYSTLPSGVRAIVVHGRSDEVIPIEHSRALAASSRNATLVEVHDDHRLAATTQSGMLAELVRMALRLTPRA